MRRAFSRFTSTFAALLSDQHTVLDLDGRLESIRAAMLDALMEVEGDHPYGSERIWEQIGRAADAQALWYLRGDLLNLLAGCRGEKVAVAKLDVISEMFRGMIPQNQMPVPRRPGRKVEPR